MFFRSLRRTIARNRSIVVLLFLLSLIEIPLHISSFRVARPSKPLDPPFARQCSTTAHPLLTGSDSPPPDVDEPRENATILMLARNSDIIGATEAIRSLDRQWNRWYKYPVIFLNDQAWSEDFKTAVLGESSGPVSFETIDRSMWSWPTDDAGNDVLDKAAALASMKKMAAKGLPYVGNENYHHMCRFYSGFFMDHPALAPYKYFWRVEPDVTYTCRIPYDAFRLMRKNEKVYGYTLALWEVGSTSPSLFRTVANYKARRGIATSKIWTSMMDASWAPLPLRYLLFSLERFFHSRTTSGDAWNFCHFWSNFEIADLDFFRSPDYRDFFAELDATGGFYHERWGDAPIHSLAAALFLKPEQLHHFADVGYRHPPFQNCPAAGLGCQCECDAKEGKIPDVCLKTLRRSVDP